MTRLWPEGQPITAAGDEDNVPLCFTWRGQTHQVDEITCRWRVDLGWWRERTWRTYYKLSTDTGLLVILYHDLENDEWYLQRLYD